MNVKFLSCPKYFYCICLLSWQFQHELGETACLLHWQACQKVASPIYVFYVARFHLAIVSLHCSAAGPISWVLAHHATPSSAVPGLRQASVRTTPELVSMIYNP